MNTVFIEKVKIALETTKPLESVREVVAEYEEINRLAKWRHDVLLSGKNIKAHQTELDKISELLEEYGYYVDICNCDADKKIREYFKKI